MATSRLARPQLQWFEDGCLSLFLVSKEPSCPIILLPKKSLQRKIKSYHYRLKGYILSKKRFSNSKGLSGQFVELMHYLSIYSIEDLLRN